MVQWWSRRQKGVVPLSSTQAEYLEFASCVKEILWVQPIFLDLNFKNVQKYTVVHEDNQPAISILKEERTKGRTKHLDVKLKFVKQAFQDKVFQVVHVKSMWNLGDFFTKPLAMVRFRELRQFFVGKIGQVSENLHIVVEFLKRYA